MSNINRRDLLKLTSGFAVLRPEFSFAGLTADTPLGVNGAAIGFETRVAIPLAGVEGARTSEGDLLLRPGETARVEATAPGPLADVAWRLRLIGEQDLDPLLREAEGGFTKLYRLIDNALDRNTTHHRTYSLCLKSKGEAFPRRAYWRVLWPSDAPSRNFPFGIWARKEDVELLTGGKLGVQVDVYQRCADRNQADISGPADATHFLDLGGGTSGWRRLDLAIPLGPDVSCLLFTVIGEKFRGSVWLEDPEFLGPDGLNSLPPFAPARSITPSRNWLAENLSQLEWPEFRIALNGTEFFRGAAFQPAHRWPAWEADVPADLLRAGTGRLGIQFTSDYHDAPGYVLRAAEWLGVPNGPIEILACPRLVEAGREFTMLISTREPDLTVEVEVAPIGSARANVSPVAPEQQWKEPNLHFVRLQAGAAGPGGTVRIRGGGVARQATVERVVARRGDGVLVGSGDSFYVPQEPESFRRFHAWYLHHRIGNATGFRPIYEWSGTRIPQSEAWQEAVRLCEGAGLKYAHIVDGRELPGMGVSPTVQMLAGPLFLGAQTHEQDGNFNYLGTDNWVRWPGEELYWDVYLRFPARDRVYYCSDPRLLGGPTMSPLFFNPRLTTDRQEAAKYFLSNIKSTRYLGPRHSGPSTLFKYFFQAGYELLIAELMYGPHEVVLGALRGASRAYRQSSYGAHLAVQWSTTPHDDPAAFRRYFLALATCYVQGVEHIHTEEGLWHMEDGFSAFDRFSPACQGHLKVIQDFYRFVQAHSRRGRMRVRAGFLHGRYDGWTCWDRAKVWGQNAPEMAFGAPEKSWDLLTTFFPRSVLAPIYVKPCPHQPVGFFTGTPFGPADIVPVEADVAVLTSYRVLMMLGWNTADTAQLERLLKYVEAGGRLMLGLPHLSAGTRRDGGPTPLMCAAARRLLGLELDGVVESSGEFAPVRAGDEALAAAVRRRKLRLGKVRLQTAEARVTDAGSVPLVVENRVGQGRVTFVNAAGWPGEDALAQLYRVLLRQHGAAVSAQERRNIWVRGSEDVSFAVYDWEAQPGATPTSTVYLLNVNWWSEPPQPSEARLLWRDAEIPLTITRDRLHVITLSGDWGIWTEDLDTDVMEIVGETRRARVKLQGQGDTRFTILRRPEGKQPAPVKLSAWTSRLALPLEPDPTPGLWHVRLNLDGPEHLEISA